MQFALEMNTKSLRSPFVAFIIREKRKDKIIISRLAQLRWEPKNEEDETFQYKSVCCDCSRCV